MNLAKMSDFIYQKIGADVFLVISTALVAPLWVNNGLGLFNDFKLINAIFLNICCIVPIFWGFWIFRKLQRIEKVIFSSLDNNTRKSIKDSDEAIKKIAKDFIANNEPYKSIAIHAIIWLIWSIGTIVSFGIKISNS